MKTFLLMGLSAALLLSARAGAQPKPKSQEEAKALQAMVAATDPDARIAAGQTVIEKFADTDFKSLALQMIASAYQQKNDFPKAVTFAERSLEADPKNFQSDLILASEYVQNTKDTDFDKEDKLKKAEKYANDTMTTLKDVPKPNPQLPDAQWDAAKKDMTANAHEILGQVAMIRKKPDAAATEFQTAISTASTQEPATYVRLAQAQNQMGKYDDAMASAQKAMDMPNAPAAVKQFAQAERARAAQKKGGGSAPGSAATATTPAPTAPRTPPPSTTTPATPPAGSTTTPPPAANPPQQ